MAAVMSLRGDDWRELQGKEKVLLVVDRLLVRWKALEQATDRRTSERSSNWCADQRLIGCSRLSVGCCISHARTHE